MNVITSIHPCANTSMTIMRWENSDRTPGRSLLLDGGTSIHIVDPEVARKMAALLTQIAGEMEQERNS